MRMPMTNIKRAVLCAVALVWCMHAAAAGDGVVLGSGTGGAITIGNPGPAGEAAPANFVRANISAGWLDGDKMGGWMPVAFLRELKSQSHWISFKSAATQWITPRDLPDLLEAAESKEPCAFVVSVSSSYLPPGRSTVGDEALFMIEGYMKGFYPPELYSGAHSEDAKQAYITWCKNEIVAAKNGKSDLSGSTVRAVFEGLVRSGAKASLSVDGMEVYSGKLDIDFPEWKVQTAEFQSKKSRIQLSVQVDNVKQDFAVDLDAGRYIGIHCQETKITIQQYHTMPKLEK